MNDDELGARSLRNARYGIQLTAPSDPNGAVAERLRALGPGFHAIAFQSRDLEKDVARAQVLKLELVRQREIVSGVRQAEFAPESGVALKLVERKTR